MNIDPKQLELAKAALARIGYVDGKKIVSESETMRLKVREIERRKADRYTPPKLRHGDVEDRGRRTYVPRVMRGCCGFGNQSFMNYP